MKRTQIYQQMPWLGGRNTTLDPAIVPTNQLVVADNTFFTTDLARKKRNGFLYLDTSTIGATTIMGGIDYWANVSSVKSQKEVVITSEPKIYSYTPTGTRTELTMKAGSNALIAGFDYVCMEVINEDLIMAFENATTPKKWNNQTGTEWEDLPGTPPNFAFCRSHKNRLFAAGVASNPDRLYYSSVDNHEEWNGLGTSGAIDIKPGDGDPEGISAIFPTIKGVLFVAKRDRLYRVDTSDADDANWSVQEVSVGIGCVGHNAVVSIGQDDVLYMSDKGVHALSATESYGDFKSAFLSKDIQKEFNSWNKGRYKSVWACHIPELNSAVFAITPTGEASNTELHLFNVEDKQWYRFPSIACDAVWRMKLSNRDTLLVGNTTGRISYLTRTELNDNGSAILFRVKTGTIYPDNIPSTMKGFKKVSLYYKPKGDYTLTAKFKIDNYPVQTLSFDLSGAFDALGSEFTLGTSVLGNAQALPMVTLPVDGYGHGFSLELIQADLNEEAEIYGFAVEYEVAGDRQEAPELA